MLHMAGVYLERNQRPPVQWPIAGEHHSMYVHRRSTTTISSVCAVECSVAAVLLLQMLKAKMMTMWVKKTQTSAAGAVAKL